MSVFDYDDKGYDEFITTRYYSRDTDGNTRELEFKLNEPNYTKAIHEYLTFLGGIFEWDRKELKAKAYEAVTEFEV